MQKGNVIRTVRAQPLVLLCCLTALSYSPALFSGFIWDDQGVFENPHFGSFAGLVNIWSTRAEIPDQTHYWLLTHTTFWLEHALFGTNAQIFHATNILIHCANCVLLYSLLESYHLKGLLVCTFLFALHPVHVESVAWIIERKVLLAAISIFYLKRD